MWIEMMFALALGQEAPAVSQGAAQLSPAETSDQNSGAVAEEPRRRGRRAEGVACQNRARTGSVLRQNICTTSRRRESESRAAQDYMGSVTRGLVTQPAPPEFGPQSRH